MNTIIRRVLAFILSFALIFATTVRANAATSVGGWTAIDTITAGATNTINAVKGAGATGMRSAVTVAASSAKVGKYLIKGGGQAAIAFAMVELADGALDWVLDPANNSVKYPVGGVSDPAGNLGGRCLAAGKYWDTPVAYAAVISTSSPVAKVVNEGLVTSTNTQFTATYVDGSKRTFRCQQYVATPYNPEQSYQSIPINTVAAKVIANAEAGHADSQEAVKATALEGFAAGEHDAALDAAAEADTGTENPPDTENPPKDGEPAPFDPAGIISAINALKALLAGILSSITSLSDWFQSEPPPEPKPEDTEIDIPVPDLPTPDTDINFGGSCPANFEFNGSIFGNPINIVLLDTSKFCGFLSTFVKFPVYAASSLFALYILGGRKDG